MIGALVFAVVVLALVIYAIGRETQNQRTYIHRIHKRLAALERGRPDYEGDPDEEAASGEFREAMARHIMKSPHDFVTTHDGDSEP